MELNYEKSMYFNAFKKNNFKNIKKKITLKTVFIDIIHIHFLIDLFFFFFLFIYFNIFITYSLFVYNKYFPLQY